MELSMNILKYAKEAGKCQRNWDTSSKFPIEHIHYILKCAEAMPTKNQIPCYDVFASTNTNLNKKLFEVSFWKNDRLTILRNGQMQAPLVLLFLRNNVQTHLHDDLILNVGIAAGGAALAAQELGYKTGFNKCFENKDIMKCLSDYAGFDKSLRKSAVLLALGIGASRKDVPRNEVYHNGKFVKTIPTEGPKEIYTTIFE